MGKIIKIGLKSNAAFLFSRMDGDTLGGTGGGTYWNKILHVTEEQFTKFKRVILAFGGDVDKSLTKTKPKSFTDEVDYECYFVKTTETAPLELDPETITLEQSEQLQQDIMAHLDGFPEELIDALCQTVVDFRNEVDPKSDLLIAMEAMFKECSMIHKYGGESYNGKQADAAIKAGRDAIAKAENN